MKTRFEKLAVAACVLAGLLGTQTTWAASPELPSPAQSARVHDIALGAEGLMIGRLVDAQGRPQASANIAIQHNGQNIAATLSNKDGYFAVKGLRGGLHTINADQARVTCRLWTERAAPPSSQKALLMVRDLAVVNGQCADACCPTAPTNLLWNAGNTALAAGALTVGLVALFEDDGSSP